MTENAEYKRIAEAALFASGRALSCEDLGSVMGIGAIGHVRKLMEEMVGEYNKRDSALEIKKVGDDYVLEVKVAYAQRISKLAGSPDISKPSLRILAYISKNEPIMQSSIVKAFGSSAYVHIKELSEKEFIRALRTGRTKKIETTPRFREYFAL